MFESIKNIFKKKKVFNEEAFNAKNLNWTQINYLLQTGESITGFVVDIKKKDFMICFSLSMVDNHYEMVSSTDNPDECEIFEFDDISEVEITITNMREKMKEHDPKYRFGIIKGK